MCGIHSSQRGRYQFRSPRIAIRLGRITERMIVADNVLSHADVLGEYSRVRQADPTLVSTTVPLDRGLEVSCVLR